MRKIKYLVSIVLLVLYISVVYAATFDFDPNINAQTFILPEDSLYYYDFNVTVTEALVKYSSDAQDKGFDVFILDNSTGRVNFTPLNDDVEYYSLTIISENRSDDADKVTITVRYNVTNTNDAPNITSYYSTDLVLSIAENSTQHFNFTATDDDTIHGDILNQTWYLNNTIVSTNMTYNYTPGFCDSGYYNITLIVNDTSNAIDSVMWNITVNNTLRPPVLNGTIANVTWQEEANLVNNITLDNYFYDLDADECGSAEENINYTVVGNTYINVTINVTTSNVSFYVPTDFFGVEIIYFIANDSYNTTRSNNITLNVTNVNDAPILNYSNLTTYENLYFYYDFNATDADNLYNPGTDILTYYDNSSMFNISSSLGIINFTPLNGDVGYHPINISVDDGTVNVSVIMYLNISPNNAPILAPIGNRNATELVYFRMNVSAFDADNDTLTFSSNFSRFDIFKFNASTANFSILPDDNDVGNYSVRITVTDDKGVSDFEIFNFSIINVNNPPILMNITNKTIRTDKQYSFNISATDPDNDNLTFYDNATFFNFIYVDRNVELIQFTASSNDVGNHTVNISVSDGTENDSQLVIFFIVNNTAPVLAGIGNWTIQEDSRFTLQINATDEDNDTLYFYANTTIFNFTTVNRTSALINFTPSQNDVGLHWINISVNDSPLRDYEMVLFNITLVNDSPYFDPTIPNINATVGVMFYYDINATDEENDSLTYLENVTLFNMSNVTGIINFTPETADIGNYTVNFSVSDGLNTNWSVILFMVNPNNRAPNITSWIPKATIAFVNESFTILFNVTVDDPDGDTITYNWTRNLSTTVQTQSWLYTPNYHSAGIYNITVFVSDGLINISKSWILSINNTNRPIKYGIVNQSNQTHFTAGERYQVNLTSNPGNITLAKSDGTNYFSEGNFTSGVIDLGATTNLSIINISWKHNKPANTDVVFRISTSSSSSGFPSFTQNSSVNFTNPNGTAFLGTSNRYIKYQAVLTTTDSTVTPSIEEVVIRYGISNFNGREDTVYLNYIDLDNFFTDLDNDDTITYNISDVDNIEVSIDGDNRVSLTPTSDWFGTSYMVVTASDGRVNVSSRNISLTFVDVSEPSTTTIVTVTSSGGGGGGGATRTVTRSLIINQSKSFEIIVPQTVSIGVGGIIEVPISIINNEDFILEGITLEANSNRSDLEISLDKTYIQSLEPEAKSDATLTIEGIEKHGSFNVEVKAKVSNPVLEDSARIAISVLENISSKISYVRDFVSLNPECIELNELIIKAQEKLQNFEYAEAELLLDDAINNCKYLISGKKINVEQLDEISFFERIIKNPYFKIFVIIIFVGILLTIAFSVYNRYKWY